MHSTMLMSEKPRHKPSNPPKLPENIETWLTLIWNINKSYISYMNIMRKKCWIIPIRTPSGTLYVAPSENQTSFITKNASKNIMNFIIIRDNSDRMYFRTAMRKEHNPGFFSCTEKRLPKNQILFIFAWEERLNRVHFTRSVSLLHLLESNWKIVHDSTAAAFLFSGVYYYSTAYTNEIVL